MNSRTFAGFFITIILVLTQVSCGSNDTGSDTDVIRLGDAPTHEWPAALSCPESLATLCAGRDLVLVGTVNLARRSVVSGATLGTEAHVLCRWPLANTAACVAIGPRGTEVKGEAAVYSLPGGE